MRRAQERAHKATLRITDLQVSNSTVSPWSKAQVSLPEHNLPVPRCPGGGSAPRTASGAGPRRSGLHASEALSSAFVNLSEALMGCALPVPGGDRFNTRVRMNQYFAYTVVEC